MTRIYKNAEIVKLVQSDTLGQAKIIRKLLQMRDLAEAEQRAASEGSMIPDDGHNADLREIELALADLGYHENPAIPDRTLP